MIKKKMKLSIVIILTYVILALSFGCSSPLVSAESTPDTTEKSEVMYADLGFNEKVNLEKTISDFIPMAQPGQEGIGMALFDIEGKPYQDESRVLPANNDVCFNLALYSYFSREVSYKLIQIIDFQQSSICIDGSKYEDGFDFTMPSNSYTYFPISLNFQEDGLHEILFLFAVSANDKSLTEDERRIIEKDHLIPYRFFINVNGNNYYQPEIQYYNGASFRKSDLNGILLNKTSEEWILWTFDTAKPKEEIPCYLHIGSAYAEEKLQCAVLLLNEWKLAEIVDGENVVYLEIEPGMEAIIPTKITAPANEGIIDVTPIVIDFPYDASKYGRIRKSFRLGINVESSGE